MIRSVWGVSGQCNDTTLYPVANTPMKRSSGSAAIVAALSGVLLVSTTPAPAARATTLSAGVRSYTVNPPNASSACHARSPGFIVKPSSTTIPIVFPPPFRKPTRSYHISHNRNMRLTQSARFFRLLLP